jgi:hypothetical protein
MSDIHVFYLVLLAMACIPIPICAYNYYREARLRENKYKLFKIRDDLIYLVAKNVIQEEDIVFREFYRMINIIIKHIDRFTVSSFIKGSTDAKEDLERGEQIKKIMESLRNRDPEVINVIDNMFETILNIMIDNSTVLKIIIKNNFLNTQIREIGSFFNNLSVYQKERNLYSLYRGYDHLRKRLGIQLAI